MSLVVDYLRELNLLSYDELHEYIVNNQSKDINSLVLYLRNLIDKEYMLHKYTPYTFIPNNDISGAGGCGDISCKINRATMFANFSALYADKVYVELNFITSEHYESTDIDDLRIIPKFKEAVEKDLALIITYCELIEYNIICITPTHETICIDCFQKEVFGISNACNIDKLKKEYCDKAEVTLKSVNIEKGIAIVRFENIPEFFPDHGFFHVTEDINYIIPLSKETIGSRVKDKDLSNTLVSNYIQAEVFKACYMTKHCQEQNAKLITNKLSDSMILGMNSNYKSLTCLESNTKLLPEYVLPIVNKLDLKNVLRLREEEQESFNKYRIALNSAILEQIKTNNESDWRKIYDDIIYPELNNLDMKLKQLKQGRLNRIFGTMVVVGSIIVANKFGDIIRPSLQTLGTAVTAAGINYILDKESTKKANLQDNDYFFLWKLKQDIKNK